MAINPLGSAGPGALIGAGTSPSIGRGSESFGQVFKAQSAPASPAPSGAGTTSPAQAPSEVKSVNAARPGPCRAGGTASAAPTAPPAAPPAAKVIDHVTAAQHRMDSILKLAESGKDFSPAELLSLQAHVYRASQELDLAGKVVEKATNGVKQVLQTQV